MCSPSAFHNLPPHKRTRRPDDSVTSLTWMDCLAGGRAEEAVGCLGVITRLLQKARTRASCTHRRVKRRGGERKRGAQKGERSRVNSVRASCGVAGKKNKNAVRTHAIAYNMSRNTPDLKRLNPSETKQQTYVNPQRQNTLTHEHNHMLESDRGGKTMRRSPPDTQPGWLTRGQVTEGPTAALMSDLSHGRS